jgi:protein-S-isoprenylcysteine O-methyltransferase Ste14
MSTDYFRDKKLPNIQMTRWGIGPKLAGSVIGYTIIVFILIRIYPNFFIVESIPYFLFATTGSILLILGLPILFISNVTFINAFKKGELVKSGVFSVVRNPIYATWILLLSPAS